MLNALIGGITCLIIDRKTKIFQAKIVRTSFGTLLLIILIAVFSFFYGEKIQIRNFDEYKQLDGSIAGLKIIYHRKNFRWNTKLVTYVIKGKKQVECYSLDLKEINPNPKIYDDSNGQVWIFKKDSNGSKIILSWNSDSSFLPQVIRNVPLEPNKKWAGRIEYKPKTDGSIGIDDLEKY